MPKLKILFLCTGNSCRSQMAEGWARHLKGDVLEAFSAGIEKHGMNPHALRVMAEAGVDMSRQFSKTPAELGPVEFDYVVSVCGHADEHCPVFPAKTRVVHVGFEDPPKLTRHLPDGEEKLAVYRRVRDEIRRFVETLPESLTTAKPGAIQAPPLMNPLTPDTTSESVRATVRKGYTRLARETSTGCCGPGVSCSDSAPRSSDRLARELGYTVEELQALPEGANMGLSCGNPAALAALQPGEVVLDLGSGGGFDVFIAGRKVGPTGRVIGVDMTPEMLARARKNISTYRERSGLDNVEFRLGEIEHLPLADASMDVVISNCVINLSPDKPQVWREIARVLKPGGRVAVSDLALLKPLPPAVAESVEALVGCVAGTVLVSETERMAREAGLSDIVLEPKSAYIEGMVDWKDPLYQKIIAQLPAGTKPSDYLTSLEITARKPTKTDSRARESQGGIALGGKLEVFDSAMCCSTGVCGPKVDPKLVQFAADVKWLQEQGAEVQRFNLSQNPAAFVENEVVKTALTEKGEAALPVILLNGKVAFTGRYPGRDELAALLKLPMPAAVPTLYTPAVAELVAIGAAIAANCEPCLKYHYQQAQVLGVSKADMASAVRMATKVKDSPHQAILRLADKLTGDSPGDAPKTAESCCGDTSGSTGGACCG